MIKEFLTSSRHECVFEDKNKLNEAFEQVLNLFTTNVEFVPISSNEASSSLMTIGNKKYLVFDYTYLESIQSINELFYKGISPQLGDFFCGEIGRYDKHNTERKASIGADRVLKYFKEQTQLFKYSEDSDVAYNTQQIISEMSKLFILAHEIGHALKPDTSHYKEAIKIVCLLYTSPSPRDRG